MRVLAKHIGFLGLALGLASPAYADEALKWDFGPFVPGNGQLVVLLDTHALKSNEVIDAATIDIQFLNSNRSEITTQRMSLLGPGQTMSAKNVYQITLRHQVLDAKEVRGLNPTFISCALGCKADDASGTIRADKKRVNKKPDVVFSRHEAKPVKMSREQLCEQYANDARRQFQRNVQRNCGFRTSNRWNDDYNVHYGWCLSAAQFEVDRESSTRRALIAQQCD